MKFVSGQIRFDVKFNDRSDQYKVKMCYTPSARRDVFHSKAVCETVNVKPPASGSRSTHGRRLAVDDPRAMAQAARAAVAFARRDEISYHAQYDRNLSHVVVRPMRRGKRR